MAELTAFDQRTGTTEEAVRDLHAALALVAEDAEARDLLATTSVDPEIDGSLALWLYGRWWVGNQPRPQPAGKSRPQVAALETGRRLAADVERGFIVLASDEARVVAARALPGAGSRIVQRAVDAVVASSRPGQPARPGDLVDLVAGSSMVDSDGVWWWVHCADPVANQELMNRFYLNVSAHTAPAAVRATVRLARSSGVPLSFKCPVDPAGYTRSDAMVVYWPRASFGDLAPHVETWLAELEPWVGDQTPPMTRQLAHGVSTAEDPGGGISYGQLRCAQVAAAVARLVAPDGSWDRRPAAGVAALKQVGIAAERRELTGGLWS